MSIVTALTTAFKTEVLSGGHNFSASNRALSASTQDVFKIALYTSAATLDETTMVYTTNNEVVGAGYTAGGATLTINQQPIATGTPNTTAFIDFDDVQWSGASFVAAGALIYNSSNGNKAVATLSFGGDKTAVGTFTIQFPAAGSGAAIVQIA
jgi:hypothetical protein